MKFLLGSGYSDMVTAFLYAYNTKNNIVAKLLIFSMKLAIIVVVKVMFVCFDTMKGEH